jgi:hypothetical protein
VLVARPTAKEPANTTEIAAMAAMRRMSGRVPSMLARRPYLGRRVVIMRMGTRSA